MVSELLEELEAITRALHLFRDAEARGRNPKEHEDEAGKLQQRSAELWTKLGQLLGDINQHATVMANTDQSTKVRNQARAALLEAGAPLLDYDRNNLATFFKSVAQSVVETQRDLDRRSIDYVRSMDPRLPPSYFAMPSVKAELKVGLREVTERGMNLVLISGREQKAEYSESTLSFELAAVPPPPGQVVELPSLVVQGSGFLAVGEERQEVLEQAERIAAEKGKELGIIFQREMRDRAVVMKRPQASGEAPETSRFLVVWPGKRENNRFWNELVILALTGPPAALELDDAFEGADGSEEGRGLLTVSNVSQVAGLGADGAARLAVALGDVLDQFLEVVSTWLAGLDNPIPR